MELPSIVNNDRRFVFNNFSTEDFIGRWNGEDKLIKAGKSEEMGMALAYHFTKHLVDRELNRTNDNSLAKREELEGKCLSELVEKDSPAVKSLKKKIDEEINSDSDKMSSTVKQKTKKKGKEFEGIK